MTTHLTAPTTFFWHDYETFGINPRRDGPAQFAGLRTDAELNVIGAPLMLYCQPPRDRLPDPESCLLTGITPQQCLTQGVNEQAFAQAIVDELAEPGTVGLGYNSIRFDDEVTRHLFWRNLIDPYAREWQNGCGRWDLVDVVRCAYALRPEGITWPKHEDGRPSFKLEHLSAANGLLHTAAHDALSDVHATLALARLIRQKQPKLFDFCWKLRSKDAVVAEMHKAQAQGKPFLHISGMYGAERGCIAVVWPLAPHPIHKNEVIVWDLAADPSELLGLSAEQIRLRLYTKTEDLPEGQTRLAIKTIHINKSPVVISALGTLSATQAERWGVDWAAIERHSAWATEHAPKLMGLWPEVFARPEAVQAAPVDVDEDLYGGFLGREDRARLERWRRLGPEAMAERVREGRDIDFDDPRLEELLFRFRARNFPDSLGEAEQARWQQHCAAWLLEGVGAEEGRLTLAAFQERIDALGESLMLAEEEGRLSEAALEQQQNVLAALYEWAEFIAP
ncbi:MAG: exodeoxyribonuclease I [Leptothrix ochracea]|uniref:exodeoxyribonuclease I n=1 Tax=Leptothrix ochracea TaxID=735331 RepID=UPI0034E21897